MLLIVPRLKIVHNFGGDGKNIGNGKNSGTHKNEQKPMRIEFEVVGTKNGRVCVLEGNVEFTQIDAQPKHSTS